MPFPRPLILPLIRLCTPRPHHLRPHHLRSSPHHAATPLPLLPSLSTLLRRPYSTSPTPPHPTSYTYPHIAHLTTNPTPSRILIDVREPSELSQTGRIPGAYNMPLTSNPDAFYLSPEEFFERFGFEKPRASRLSGRGNGIGEGKRGCGDGNPYSPEMKEREAQTGLNAGGVDSMRVNEEVESANAAADAGGGAGQGEGVEEVIFYCKAGVRSRAAARMAREWEGLKVGQYDEGWLGWEKNGGKVER